MKIPVVTEYNSAAVSRVLETLDGENPDFKIKRILSYFGTLTGGEGQHNVYCGCARGAIRWDMKEAGKLHFDHNVHLDVYHEVNYAVCGPLPPISERPVLTSGYEQLDPLAYYEAQHLGLPELIVHRMESLFEGYGRFQKKNGPWIARWLRRVLKIESPVQAVPVERESPVEITP